MSLRTLIPGRPMIVGEGRPEPFSWSEQSEQQQQTGPAPVPPAPGQPAPPPAPTPPAPPAPAPPPGAPAGTPGPAGGVDALRADLASERDRRQAAEQRLAALEAAAAQQQQAQESAETARVRQQLEAQAQQAQTTAATAIAHLVRSEARRVAVAAGVHDDRSETFLRLVDLTGVQLDTNGIPDATAIRTAVDAGLTAAPEFRATTGGPRRAPAPPGGQLPGGSPPPEVDLQTQVSGLLQEMQTTVGITPTAAPTT